MRIIGAGRYDYELGSVRSGTVLKKSVSVLSIRFLLKKPVLNRLWIYMVDRTGVIRNIE